MPKPLIIDIFKGTGLYDSLKQYNNTIEEIADTVSYKNGYNYNVNNNEASFWFDPRQVRKTPMFSSYPHINHIQLDNRLSLMTHCVNHQVIAIVNALYRDNNDIIIEDMCCGMGNQIFYLSKLGFKNFNAIDNFSQLPQALFERLMKAGSINYTLNNMQALAVVSSVVAYPAYVKVDKGETVITDSLELFLSYIPAEQLAIYNDNFNKQADHLDITKFGFVNLFIEANQALFGYCRENKFNEFSKKLQSLTL